MAELRDDPLISRHLNRLYSRLMEANLLRIVEPFSRVELDHVAHLIGLPVSEVETKLSQVCMTARPVWSLACIS